jgi:hypothetical protein
MDESPNVTMFPMFHLDNWIGLEGSPRPKMDLDHNISLQVDYIRCFAPKERFEAWSQEIDGLVFQVEEYIEDLVEKGFPCQEEKEIIDLIGGNWVEGNYNYVGVKRHVDEIEATLGSFLKLLPERGPVIEDRFSMAMVCIDALDQGDNNRAALIAKADLSRAEKAWWTDMDYELTSTTLDKIIMRCPEPVLLIFMMLAPFLLWEPKARASS